MAPNIFFESCFVTIIHTFQTFGHWALFRETGKMGKGQPLLGLSVGVEESGRREGLAGPLPGGGLEGMFPRATKMGKCCF